VLVCGWGTNSFMADLLRELDHGLRCLAPGSQVLLCNQHSPGASLKAITADLGLSNISIKHVRANPLKRQELRQVGAGRCVPEAGVLRLLSMIRSTWCS
jgi:hypothetical protein